MTGSLLFCLILSLALGGSCYFASENLYASAGVFLLFFLLSAFVVAPMLSRFQQQNRKRHECYQLVNAFIVSLSVSKSLERSYQLAIGDLGAEAKKLNGSVSELSAMEKIEYFSSYFNSGIYDMFVAIVGIYCEQGGDVLSLSSGLLAELTRIEETELSLIARNQKNLVEFCALWAMSLAIVLFIRFGLSSFYGYLKGSVAYLLSLVAFFLLMGVSFVCYFSSFTGQPILGERKKNKGLKKERRAK